MQACCRLRNRKDGMAGVKQTRGRGVGEEVGEMSSSWGKELGFYCNGNGEPLKVLSRGQT